MAALNVDDFLLRWQGSGGSERADFRQFAIELSQLLCVPGPQAAKADAQNDDYRFVRPVTFVHTGTQSRGFIDLYRRGTFVMEAKQGTGQTGDDDSDAQLALLPDLPPRQRRGHGVRGSRRRDDTMLRARNQADGYARAVARTAGGLVTSKKARAWETYVERWDAKAHPHENGMLDVFLACVAEACGEAVRRTGG